jgi:hypothetical protein
MVVKRQNKPINGIQESKDKSFTKPTNPIVIAGKTITDTI